MFRTIKIDLVSSNPAMPLPPIETFEGSAVSLTILNAPRELGKRAVVELTAIVTDVDGVTRGIAATRVGSAWGVTIPVSALGSSGSVEHGVMIVASGLDEKGAVVPFWVLGIADLVIMKADGSVAPGEVRDTVHFFATAPANPSRGDIAPIEGVLKLFNGDEWMDIGGGSSGSGAIVLHIDSTGKKVFNGDVEITTFNDLLALVRSGGVVLMGTVGSQKDALFYPLYCDTTAIRFDATGALGYDVQTKSYTMQPTVTGGIRIGEGSTTVLAKKSDIAWDNLTGKPELNVAGRTIRNFNREAVDNTAILTAFKIPQALADRAGGRTIFKIRMQGPTTATGSWDSQDVCLRFFTDDGVFSKLAAPSGPIEVGKPIEFEVNTGFILSDVDDLTFGVFSANNRSKFGLVSVDASEGYDLTLSNGNHLTNFAPFLEFELAGGEIVTTYAKDVGDKVEKAGAAKLLASNASQAQIIAKINELINNLK